MAAQLVHAGTVGRPGKVGIDFIVEGGVEKEEDEMKIRRKDEKKKEERDEKKNGLKDEME